MADYRIAAAYLFAAEGGNKVTDSKTDAGGLTCCGITYKVWVAYFGDTLDRFKKMESADWFKIFKGEFWDKILGDDIKDQRICNEICEWTFNSGKYYPERDIQDLINLIFHQHLAVDGSFGNATIAAINSLPQDELYQDILQRHRDYYKALCAGDIQILKQKYPDIQDESLLAKLAEKEGMKNLPNLRGWLNRIDNMVAFNKKYVHNFR